MRVQVLACFGDLAAHQVSEIVRNVGQHAEGRGQRVRVIDDIFRLNDLSGDRALARLEAEPIEDVKLHGGGIARPGERKRAMRADRA